MKWSRIEQRKRCTDRDFVIVFRGPVFAFGEYETYHCPFRYVLPIPISIPFTCCSSREPSSFLLDTINDKIYQAASIDYVVKGDPEHRPITIAAMGNFFRYPDVGVDGGKLIRFEVYLDPTPLVGRMGEIAALKEKS
jgi:hypothetical protein